MRGALPWVVAAAVGGCVRDVPESLELNLESGARSVPAHDVDDRIEERRQWVRELMGVAQQEAERCPTIQYPPLGVPLTSGATLERLSVPHASPAAVTMQAHPAVLPGLVYYAATHGPGSLHALLPTQSCFIGHGSASYCGNVADDAALRRIIADFELDTRPEQLDARGWIHLVAALGGAAQILAMPGESIEGCHGDVRPAVEAKLVAAVDISPGGLSLSVPLDVRWRHADGARWLTYRVEIAAGRAELSTEVLTHIDEDAALWGDLTVEAFR